MSYNFLLDKKTIIILLTGLFVVGLLLFLAGVLVGVRIGANLPSAPNQADSSARSAVTSGAATSPPQEATVKQEVPQETAKVEATGGAQSAPPPEKADASAAPQQARDAAPAQPPPEPAANPAAGSMAYSIQVGAFLIEDNAKQLLKELESKGHKAHIFTAKDSKDRLWHAVRIGSYASWQEASQAASAFSKQEKIGAIVRPVNSL